LSMKQMSSQITMLQKLRENYQKKAEYETARLEELKEQVKLAKASIDNQRKSMR